MSGKVCVCSHVYVCMHLKGQSDDKLGCCSQMEFKKKKSHLFIIHVYTHAEVRGHLSGLSSPLPLNLLESSRLVASTLTG